MIRELLKANLHKDIEKLRVVEKLLTDLRATWAEAIEINDQAQVPLQKKALAIKVPRTPGSSTPDNYVPLSISR